MASTETEPADRYQVASDTMRSANRIAEPPAYPMPRERSAKSAMVVPAVVVATITNQYRKGWKALAATCVATARTKMTMKIALLTA